MPRQQKENGAEDRADGADGEDAGSVKARRLRQRDAGHRDQSREDQQHGRDPASHCRSLRSRSRSRSRSLAHFLWLSTPVLGHIRFPVRSLKRRGLGEIAPISTQLSTTASAESSAGAVRDRCPVGLEDVFDSHVQGSGEGERDGKAWVVAAPFDRDDRLTRHADLAGEIGLSPAALGPQLGESVLQLRRIGARSTSAPRCRSTTVR